MKRLVCCLVFFIAFVHTSLGRQGPERAPNDYKVAVNVDLVIFNVTVTDPKGRVVHGLTQNDFRIVEDGLQQDIQFVRPEDIPATVGLLIDNSGSMRRKRDDVVAAALAFAESRLPVASASVFWEAR